MPEQRVSIEIDAETRRRLKVMAAEAGMTVKEFVRSLVEREWGRDGKDRTARDAMG